MDSNSDIILNPAKERPLTPRNVTDFLNINDKPPPKPLIRSTARVIDFRKPQPVQNKREQPFSIVNITNTKSPQRKAIIRPKVHLLLPKPQPTKQTYVPLPMPITDDAGIRCVCWDNRNYGKMIECDQCKCWLHAPCINISQIEPTDVFICPFCLGQVVNCKCGKKTYDKPLIRCCRCKNWVHKECNGLGFGRIPLNFICRRCAQITFPMPRVFFTDKDDEIWNAIIPVDRVDILNDIPPGRLYQKVSSDLMKSELDFRETIEDYFQMFTYHFFNESKEFWKTLSNVLTEILSCTIDELLAALDLLAIRFLYNPTLSLGIPMISGLQFNEDVEEFLLAYKNIPRSDPAMGDVNLYEKKGHVYTSTNINDNQVIAELSGFLCFTDSIKADDGIPRNIIVLANEISLSLDMKKSIQPTIPKIRRSFHFNCVAKLVRIGDSPAVVLVATRLKGPLLENKRGFAIGEGEELFLPFDGELPFPVDKTEWREKVKKTKYVKEPVRHRKPPELTLLSLFLSDDVPPIHTHFEGDSEEDDEDEDIDEVVKRRKSTRRRRKPARNYTD